MTSKKLVVLGIRGVPASHGGFETFAEYLCCYLVEKNWDVTVYCQEDGPGPVYETSWEGVKRIHIPIGKKGPLGTILFDWRAILHALRREGIFLTLGYNTAIFNIVLRASGKCNLINMDGIEWKRQKWGLLARIWFWINERIGCWVGNCLIADHPEIENHLATRVSRRKITMIPYGGKRVVSADESVVLGLGLEVYRYALVVARPEPENSILEIVQAFSKLDGDFALVILGNYQPETNSYHHQILESANDRIIFPGAIYDPQVVEALRFFCRFYVHGHQVGGTNPSLVEALGAGNAVLAHDNKFNRWVAGETAEYFSDVTSLERLLREMFVSDDLIERCKEGSRKQFDKNFKWNVVLHKYERLFESQL